MDITDRNKITENLSELIDNIQLELLTPRLISSGIFTADMVETFSVGTSRDRKREMFMALQRRGDKAFRKFIDCLLACDMTTAANILDPSVHQSDHLNNNSRDQVAGGECGPNVALQNSEQMNAPPDLSQRTCGQGHTLSEGTHQDYGHTCPINDAGDIQPLTNITVRPATVYRGPPEYDAYQMLSLPRGKALIINNVDFENEIKETRYGSDVDANNLDLLLNALNYEVRVRRNLHLHEMKEELNNLAKTSINVDSCIIAILTHGEHRHFWSYDNKRLEEEWVLERFNNVNCPAFSGKPKFFILQACRGDKWNHAISKLPANDQARIVPDSASVRYSQQHIPELPEYSDMVVAYATIPGYVAIRDVVSGSWFIESICKVFMERAFEDDLYELLRRMQARIQNQYTTSTGWKQTCETNFRNFTKKMYFNPGL